MKIAVIYPPNPDQSLHLIRDEYVCRQVPSVPFPAMLAQLCAVMRSHFPSAEIRAIDASAENFTLEQCAESVDGCEFAFLFSTAQTIPFDVSLLLLINKKNPHTALFVINPLSAGLYAESILTQFTFCAGIITSGFLQAVPDITARYPDIQTVHSVYLYEKNTVRYNPPDPCGIHYDALPYMAYDAVPLHRYSLAFLQAPFAEKLIPGIRMHTEHVFSIGNPYKGVEYPAMSAARIVEELAYAVKEWGIWGVDFLDKDFTKNTFRLEALCNLIITHSIRLQWRCRSNSDTLTLPLLKLMYRAGCRELILTCSRTANQPQAEHELSVLNARLRLIHKTGIRARIHFCVGFKWESENTLNQIYRWIRSCTAGHIALLPVFPYTDQTDTVTIDKNLFTVEQKLLSDESFNQHFWCDTDHLSRETLRQLHVTAGNKAVEQCFIRTVIRHPFDYIRLLKQSRSFAHSRFLIGQGIARLKRAVNQ